jgi:ribosomal protein L13E
MSEALAAPAPNRPNRELSELQIQAALAYGRGYRRREIAKAMVDALSPTTVGKPMDFRLGRASRKLKAWERNQKFRDYVYQEAVTKVDMQVPLVLDGVVQRAIRGRVDAARLILEITGRHNPKGEQAAPTVVVAIDGISRPSVQQIGDAEVVDAEPS